jgi:Family of unknown function (DUF6134)
MIMTEGNTGSRAQPWERLANRLSVAAIVGVLAGVSTVTPTAAQTSAQLSYRVTHSVFGDIGTYTNTLEPNRDGVTVQTRAHFEVKMLGIRMYREDAERTERWQANRLVSFHGITDKGNGPAVVNGEAHGNNFVITSPQGTVTAPASVHPANPWSANFLRSDTMMRPDTGKIERVRVSGGQEAAVSIGGTSISARRYEVDGATRYTVWLDAHDVPVMFVIDDDTGKVTFTLDKCAPCGPVVSQLGAR